MCEHKLNYVGNNNKNNNNNGLIGSICSSFVFFVHLDVLRFRRLLLLPLGPVQELLFEQGRLVVLRQPPEQRPARPTFRLP